MTDRSGVLVPRPWRRLLHRDVLAGLMLVVTFLMQGQSRLFPLLRLFVWQSAVLAAMVALAGFVHGEPEFLVSAVLTVALKCFFLPRLFARTAKMSRVLRRLALYLRPSLQSFLAACLIVFAFIATRSLVAPGTERYAVAAVSVASVLLGLQMLTARKGLFGQMVGFLVMENGIFAFGLALVGGLPLVVEISIFFDVLIGAVLMAALTAKVQEQTGSVTTDRLTELVD